MITEYAVPSLALNYHSKKYQIIYESVYIVLFVYMHEKQILMQEWICMKCPHKSNVEGDQYFNSRSTCMSLLRHGCQRHSFFKFPDWQSNVHFPWPNELTICADINGFQIPVKTSCTGHRWCKTKDFFVFCSGKICWVCFHGYLFFCFMSSVSGTQKNAQTPITAILSTYLIHKFIVNVKWRMDRSPEKPYICLSFDFLIQYSANGTCLTSVNMQEYVTSLWLLWNSYIFPDLFWDSLTWLTGND